MAQRNPQKDYQGWIGEGIIDVREAARLTQEELAPLIGVSKQTVWNMEHGVVRAKEESVRRIAEECAGRGWLPSDPDLIEDYILGIEQEVPMVTRRTSRPRLRLVRDEPADSVDSTGSDSEGRSIPGYLDLPLSA